MQAIKAIPVVLVSSFVVVWLTVLVVPGIHLDGPAIRQAQAIAVAALVFLMFVMCGRVAILISSLRQLRQRGAVQGVDDASRGEKGDAAREIRHREATRLPAMVLIVSLVSTPFALWLSEVLCAALGLPLRIDDLRAILSGWLVVIVVRLLIGAALKLAATARQ
ncbi:hypothetical protein ACSDR0_49295 [Streptosporangium sp. G11]|uniref:hypothetical protein n=1 Tax=Streptosporangium sp. G11 TaxID=3436926 RepID=UPI003EBF89E4